MPLVQKFCQFTQTDAPRRVRIAKAFNPDQPRDERGRFAGGGDSEQGDVPTDRTAWQLHDDFKALPVRTDSSASPLQHYATQKSQLDRLESAMTDLKEQRDDWTNYDTHFYNLGVEAKSESESYARQGKYNLAISSQEQSLAHFHQALAAREKRGAGR